MKKILSLLISFLSLNAFGQIERTVTFDFTKPSQLTPTLNMDDKATVSVDDLVFTSGPISLSFAKTKLSCEVLKDFTTYGEDNPVTFLSLHRGCTMTISSKSNVELLSFKFDEMSKCGGLGLTSGSLGYFILGEWSNNDVDEINSVSLFNSSAVDASINQITVTYRTPQDLLEYQSVSPINSSIITEFDGYKFTFSENVTVKSGASFYLFDKDGNPVVQLNANVNKNVVELTPITPLTNYGDYTLNISKGIFSNSEGLYNKEINLGFTYKEAENSFKYTAITTASGNVTSIPSTIELIYPSLIGYVSDVKIPVLDSNGEEVRTLELTRKDDSEYKTVSLQFTNGMGAITKAGIYTLTIPEKSIYNNKYDATATDLGVSAGARYNPEFTLTYKVADPNAPTTAEITEAKDLLAKQGIGYPKSTASERISLSNLISTIEATYIGTSVELQDAVAKYLACTDVVSPEDSKYYSVYNVAYDGTKRYLYYDDDKVSLTKDASMATSFKVTDRGNGKLSLSTYDNKYLHSFVSNNLFDGTTTKNISDLYSSDVNDLTFAKLNVEGVSNSETFGLFSFYGSIGQKSAASELTYKYSLVDVVNESLFSDDDTWFNANSSSAFSFTETSAPDPDVSYVISSDQNNGTITIVFSGATNLAVNRAYKASLAGNGVTTDINNITISGDNNNIATIKTSIIDNGEYTLTIPSGMLYFYNVDHIVNIPVITYVYNVSLTDVFNYDFDQKYHLSTNISSDAIYDATKLNNISLITPDTEFCPNNIDVYTYNYLGNYIVGTGKLTARNEYTTSYKDALYRNGEMIGYVAQQSGIMILLEDGTRQIYNSSTDEIKSDEIRDYTYYLDLVNTPKVNTGNIKTGQYCVVIPRGTYGDSNYGKYLKGDSKVKRSDCHLNERAVYYIDIENTSTGINKVENITQDCTIYSAEGMSTCKMQHGVNIIRMANGKVVKVFVK